MYNVMHISSDIIMSRNKKDIGAYCWRKGVVNMISKKDFIRIGDDRLSIKSIERYGICTTTRYFVKNETRSEVSRDIYEKAFYLYMADEELDVNANPIFDINGYPVFMDMKIIREGYIPPDAFEIQKVKALYVQGNWGQHSVLIYFDGECGIDIDGKISELDALLIGVQEK